LKVIIIIVLLQVYVINATVLVSINDFSAGGVEREKE